MLFCLSLLVYITFVESNHNNYYDSKLCYKTNFDFYGHDLHITDAINYYECQEICLKDWDCQFFTFSIKLQKCYLKDKVIFMRYSEDRISGPKSCRGHRGIVTMCQERQQQDDNTQCRPTSRAFFYVKEEDNKYCCLDIEGNSNSVCKDEVKKLQCDDFTLCQKRKFKDKLQCGSSTNCLHYVTQCDSDGDFKVVQSDGLESWCVNIINGIKIEGSEHQGRANEELCIELNRCWTAAKQRADNCDTKTTARRKYECLASPDTRPPRCQRDGKVKSKVCDVRGGIKFCWCIDYEGNPKAGTFMEIKKDQDDFDCEIPPICMAKYNEQIQTLTEGATNIYIPQCRKSDRSFLRRQCQGGLCWCVDRYGEKLTNVETYHPLSKYYDCIPCEEKRKMQQDGCTNEDCFVFTCMSNDQLYSPKQCHHSICWCVDRWGSIIKGSYQNKKKNLVCPNYNICPSKTNKECEMSGAYTSEQKIGDQTFYVDSEGNSITIARTACQDKLARDLDLCDDEVDEESDCFFANCDDEGKFMNKGKFGIDGEDQCLDSKLTPKDECIPFTKCQQAHLEQFHGECLHKTSSECYIPQCEENGQFKPRQCEGSICWCVDVNGEQTVGIHQAKFHHGDHGHDHLHHEIACREFTDCEIKYAQDIFSCESGDLSRELCEIVQCSADGEYEPTQCLGGECKCVDSTGTTLGEPFLLNDADEKKKLCVDSTGMALGETSNCIDLKKRETYLDCDEFGYFKPLQCDDNDNCWCVSPLGIELEMSDPLLPPHEEIECMQIPKDTNTDKPLSCNGRCVYFYDNHFDHHVHHHGHPSNYAHLFSSYRCGCDPGCVARNDCCKDYRKTCLY